MPFEPRNPYTGLPKGTKFHRLNVDIPLDKMMTLKSVAPNYGMTQSIVALYVKSILRELELAGITSWSPENYDRFVAIIQRYTHPDVVRDAIALNDTGATTGVREPHSNPSHLAADVKGKSGAGKQGVRKKVVKG